MSDDIITDSGYTNKGATLPSSKSATHNAGLSPFYITRNGFNGYENTNEAITARGSQGYLWSTSNIQKSKSNYLAIDVANSLPSGNNGHRYFGFSLRCLVSTNNG